MDHIKESGLNEMIDKQSKSIINLKHCENCKGQKKRNKSKGKSKDKGKHKVKIDNNNDNDIINEKIIKKKFKKKKGLKQKSKAELISESVIKSVANSQPKPESQKKIELGYYSKFKNFLPKFIFNIIESTEPKPIIPIPPIALIPHNNIFNDIKISSENNTSIPIPVDNNKKKRSNNDNTKDKSSFSSLSNSNINSNNNNTIINNNISNRSNLPINPFPIPIPISKINSIKDQTPTSTRISSFGKLYNHDNPITSRTIFQSENIISLLQFPNFPCHLNKYNTTEKDIDINEQSKWNSIFNPKEYEDSKNLNPNNKISFLPHEKFESIFACYFLINKYSIPVLTVITNQRILFLDMQQRCLMIYKGIKINELTAIYYHKDEIIFYQKIEVVIHIKISKTKRSHMTPEEVFIIHKENEKQNQQGHPQEDIEKKKSNKTDHNQTAITNKQNKNKMKQIAIRIWRLYLSITLSPIHMMKIYSDTLFHELDEKKTIMEVSLLIMMQQKKKIAKIIKHKKDFKKKRKEIKIDQQTSKSRGDKSVYKNFEIEFNSKPFNGIGYILNADNLQEPTFSICYFLFYIDFLILYLYQKIDMIIIVDLERIFSIKINKERYVMVLDLVKEGKSKESIIKDIKLKIKRGISIDNNTLSLERIVLFTCGNDDSLYGFFKTAIYYFIEKNLQFPDMFLLSECYTKDLVTLSLPDTQGFLNLLKNFRSHNLYDNNQDLEMNRWDNVPVAKSYKCYCRYFCCCIKSHHHGANNTTAKIRSFSNNKALFLSNLHPEQKNDKCIIY